MKTINELIDSNYHYLRGKVYLEEFLITDYVINKIRQGINENGNSLYLEANEKLGFFCSDEHYALCKVSKQINIESGMGDWLDDMVALAIKGLTRHFFTIKGVHVVMDLFKGPRSIHGKFYSNQIVRNGFKYLDSALLEGLFRPMYYDLKEVKYLADSLYAFPKGGEEVLDLMKDFVNKYEYITDIDQLNDIGILLHLISPYKVGNFLTNNIFIAAASLYLSGGKVAKVQTL